MITGISGGPYVYISDNTGGAVGYTPNSNPLTGSVRYNQYGQMEMYDGYSWRVSSQQPKINLSEAIEWALEKMKKEKELEEMVKKHPAIKAAFDNFRKAEEQLKTTIILSQEKI